MTVFVALLSLMACQLCHAEARVYNVPFYDAWNGLPSDTLLARGYRFLVEGGSADSALVCYTIVANRYYEGRRSSRDITHATEAMVNLGAMYMEYFPDYKRAYEYLLKAKELAEANGIKHLLGYVYLSLCNITDIDGMLHYRKEPQLLTMLQRAFRAALDAQDYDLATAVAANLVQKAVEYGKPDAVKKEIGRFLSLNPPRRPELWLYTRKLCGGLDCYAAGDYAGAAACFMDASRYADAELLAHRYEISALVLAARMYLDGSAAGDAEAVLRKALSLAVQNGCKDYEMIALERLEALFREEGKREEARRCEYQYLRLKDSLVYYNFAADIDKVRFLNELAGVNAKVKAISARHRQLVRVLCMVLVAVSVLGTMFYLLCRSYRRLKNAHNHLYMQNVELLKREEAGTAERKPKYVASNMDTGDKKELFGRIVNVMQTSGEIYSQGFTLNRLAELVHSRYRYVSQVINEETGGNFNTLLNKYRINEACRRMNDVDTYGNYKVEAIAEGVGFKSRTGFSALFKKITGLSPSEYHSLARSNSGKHA